jgi:hypothetical protein
VPAAKLTGSQAAGFTTDRSSLKAGQADINFSVNMVPFLGLAQPAHQLFKTFAMLWRKFEPGKKVEGFAKLATVVQAPSYGRQVLQADRNMAG